MIDKYTPIPCAFYDQLELFALKKQIILIEYTDNKVEHSFPAIIKRFVTRKNAEFIVTTNNIEIRLDKITSINGLEPEFYCQLK